MRVTRGFCLVVAVVAVLGVGCSGSSSQDRAQLQALKSEPILDARPVGFTPTFRSDILGHDADPGYAAASSVSQGFDTTVSRSEGVNVWADELSAAGWRVSTVSCDGRLTATKQLDGFVAFATVSIARGATLQLAAPDRGAQQTMTEAPNTTRC